MIGKTVSHYRILSSLGAGGMGVVYGGEDVRLGRPVALKFVPEELARDHSAVARLMDEARTASGLNHPNICTIYDIGEYDGRPFIVMELLKGQTLRDRLEAAPLKAHDVVEIGIQVADALDAAHRRDIIHRDIKPANLFLVDRGPAKILDFGLAKLVPRAATATTAGLTRDQTAEGVTLGTVSYMSPEQVTGEELDGRSDLFSLGVVLYEALTGHQPFTGKTSAVIFSAILTRAPVAPVVLNPSVPLRLQEVINTCLEKDRELRYQDAAGLRAELRRVKRDLESGRSGVYRVSGSAAIADPDAADSSPSRRAIPPASDSARSQSIPASRTGRKFPYVLVASSVVLAAALAVGAFLWWPRATRSDTPGAAASATFVGGRLALATAAFDSKDYQAASAYATEVLRVSPDDREAARIRDDARAKLARFDDAVAQASQRLASGDTKGAMAALDEARAIRPAAPIVGELSARLAGQAQAASLPHGAPPPARPAVVPSSGPPPTHATQPLSAAVSPAPPSPAAPPPPSPSAPPATPAATPPPPTDTPALPAPERRDPAPATARDTESDDAAIRRVVATYARAIETKDIGLFRSVKPNLSGDEQRRIEEGFRAVASQRVVVTIVSIEQRAQDAFVRLKRRDTIQAGGRQQTTESMQTMTLARTGSAWVIQEIGR